MRKYIKDYENVVETDEFGFERKVAVYIGDYFKVNLDEENLNKYRRYSLFLVGMMIIGQLAAGFVATQAMYAFYVSLPYVFTFLPLYFLIDSSLRLPQEDRNFKRDEVELSFNRIKNASKFMLALVGVTIIGDIVFMILHSQGFELRELIYPVVEIIVAGLDYLLLRLHKPVTVTQIVGNSAENQINSPKSVD
jgi:hypothetical protein